MTDLTEVERERICRLAGIKYQPPATRFCNKLTQLFRKLWTKGKNKHGQQ